MNRLYGTLDHGLKLYTLLTSILTVGAGVPIYLVLAPPYIYGTDPYVMMGLLLLGLVTGVAVVFFCWGINLPSIETKGAKWGVRGMYFRKRRIFKTQTGLFYRK